MVPSSCWFTNVRSHVAAADWERLRKMVYRRAGNRCEACGAGKNPDARRWLEAHERWRYLRETRSGRLVQRLTRLSALCSPCHEATHFGYAQVTGHEQAALEHLCYVNGWTPQQAWNHVDQAAEKWRRRSQHTWELDLSILTDAGLTITPPPAGVQRPEHAAAALREVRLGDPPRPSRAVGAVPGAARGGDDEPGVTGRPVSADEVATSDDPMARVLRGESPFPR